MISPANIKDSLLGWMSARSHMFKLGSGILTTISNYIENVEDARWASMPGQTRDADDPFFKNPEALKLIGRDCRLPRGILEGDASYAERLRRQDEAWKYAGTYRGLINALGAVLVPGPFQIHIVRSGYAILPVVPTVDWWTLNDSGLRYLTKRSDGSCPGIFWAADGSGALPANDEPQDWNWDSASWDFPLFLNPDDSRIWIIISHCNPPQLNSIEGPYNDSIPARYGDADLTGDKKTIGTTATESYVRLIRHVLKEWKAPGCRVEKICIEFADNLWDPLLGYAMPDGHWKYHGKSIVDSGIPKKVRARDNRGRYFSGTEALSDAI